MSEIQRSQQETPQPLQINNTMQEIQSSNEHVLNKDIIEAHERKDRQALISLRSKNADLLGMPPSVPAPTKETFQPDKRDENTSVLSLGEGSSSDLQRQQKVLHTDDQKKHTPENIHSKQNNSLLEEKQTKQKQETNQSIRILTSNGGNYDLTVHNNATIEDVKASLQAQGANDLADYIDRHVATKENEVIHPDKIQKIAATFRPEKMHKIQAAEKRGKNRLKNYVLVGLDNGKKYNLRLPKNATARDIQQALEAQGEHKLAQELQYMVPETKTVPRAVLDLLRSDLADLPEALDDLSEVVKKILKGIFGPDKKPENKKQQPTH